MNKFYTLVKTGELPKHFMRDYPGTLVGKVVLSLIIIFI